MAEIMSSRNFIVPPSVLWRRLTAPPFGLIRWRSRWPEEKVSGIASCLPSSDGVLPTENGVPNLGVEHGIRQDEVAAAEERKTPHAQQDVVGVGWENGGSSWEVLGEDDSSEEEEVGVDWGQAEVRGGL